MLLICYFQTKMGDLTLKNGHADYKRVLGAYDPYFRALIHNNIRQADESDQNPLWRYYRENPT